MSLGRWQIYHATDQVQSEQAALQAEFDQLQALIDTAEQQAQRKSKDLLDHESRLQKLEAANKRSSEKRSSAWKRNCELDRGRVAGLARVAESLPTTVV